MLRILLFLLKIIGIVLLSVLGILFLVLILVLFVPVRYKVKAKKDDEMRLKARIRWLFGFLSVKLDYLDEKLTYSARVCGKLIVSDKPKKKKQKKKRKKTGAKLRKSHAHTKKTKKQHSTEGEASSQSEKRLTSVSDQTPEVKRKTESTSSHSEIMKKIDEDISGKKNKPKKKTLFEKIKEWKRKSIQKIKALLQRVRNILGKISRIKEFIKNADNKPGFLRTLLHLKKFLRHIKPKKLVVTLKFGTGDPCSTGQLLGAICAIYPNVIGKVQLQPDFDRKIIEGELYARGRVRILTLLIVTIKVILDKDIKTVRKNFMNLKEEL